MEIPVDAPKPRLCYLLKWPDFDGYGFNLHAEKSKLGQYIGKVDEESPASMAGLMEGDRIIEVNGINIANENHRQVVERIKSIPNETKLLVLDEAADRWYKEKKLVVKGNQPHVIHQKTPTTRPSGHANGGQENGDVTLVISQCVEDENMNNKDIHHQPSENNNHIIGENKKSHENLLNNVSRVESPDSVDLQENLNGSSRSSTPQSIQKSQGSSEEPHEDNRPSSSHSNANSNVTSTPTPGSPSSDKSDRNSRPASIVGVDLNLNMSASEMRKIISQRKKHDPKKTQMDLKQKYEIIQQM